MESNDNRYTLYSKDDRILDFHCERNVYNESEFIVDVSYSDMLPFYFNDPNFWIRNRRAPRNREHMNEILRKCGCKDPEGFIRFSYCASLNDTFWVKPFDKDLSWEDVSLYRNRFDEGIAKIAFDGGQLDERSGSRSPELTTDGMVAKCWRRFGDDICLIKRGAKLPFDEDTYGFGPQSEMYTYELAKHLCQNPLEYNVIKYHGKVASRCRCFCDENISYVPIASILGERARLSQCLGYYDAIGCGEQFREMLVLDSLTYNNDRHLKNFGVLYEADTLKVIGMAPVFDNNLALFPNHRTEKMKDLDAFLMGRTSHFDIGFDELSRICMTPAIRKKLTNLQGFKFDRSGDFALEDERLTVLETMIARQIDVALDRKVYAIGDT